MRNRLFALLVLLCICLAVTLLPASASSPEDPSSERTPEESTTDPAETVTPDQSVRGTLVFEGEPVAGVAIVVSRDREEVGITVSGDDGSWEVPVPEPGTYDVALQVETLPEDVSLRNPDRDVLTVDVRPGQHRPLLFALGERAAGGPSQIDRFLNLAVDGVKIGSIIALAALGLSLIFGITGLINFAHGELVTFGALVAWFFNASTGGPGLSMVAATLLAVGIGAMLGAGTELGLWRPLRRRKTGRIQMFVISIGLALFLRHLYLLFYGPQARAYRGYAVQSPLSIGPISLPPRDLFIIIVSLIVLSVVGILLQTTRTGTAMRAVADNRDLAEASGINVQRVILWTWIAGAGLAALGGTFQGLTEAVRWNMGFNILLLMFAAVILGGLGTAYGAMVGGLMIGMVIQLSTFWVSTEFKFAMALAVMTVMLLIRPQGILGRRERIG